MDRASFQAERVAALNIPLATEKVLPTTNNEEPVEIDSFNLVNIETKIERLQTKLI